MASNNKSNLTTQNSFKNTHLGLRKLPIGLASVALGASLYLGASNANADTIQTTDQQPAQNQSDNNAVLPGTPNETNSTNSSQLDSQTEVDNQSLSSSSHSSVETTNETVNQTGSSTTSDNQSLTENSSSSTTPKNTSDSNNQEVTMKYYVHDDDNNDKVVYVDKASVKKGDQINAKDLTLPQNYTLSKDSTITVQDKDFKADIHVKHVIVRLKAPAPTSVERTIVILNPDGSKKTVKQQGYYQTPDSEIDEVTKETKKLGEATLTGINAYKIPEIKGYKASLDEVPALTAKDYDNGAKLQLEVSYVKDGETPNVITPSSESSASSNSSASQASASDSGQSSNNSSAASNATSESKSDSGKALPASNASTEVSDVASQASEATSTSSDSADTSENEQSSEATNENYASPANSSSLMQVATTPSEGSAALGQLTAGTGAVYESSTTNQNQMVTSGDDELPQTGNDTQKELAALGLGTLGVIGTVALNKRKKYAK